MNDGFMDQGNTREIHERGVQLICRHFLKYDVGMLYPVISGGFRLDRPGYDFSVFGTWIKSEWDKTVAVRAVLGPKPAGGKGAPTFDWWLSKNSNADLVAVTCLESDQAWLFSSAEFKEKAQQKSAGGWHLYFYTEPNRLSEDGPHERDYDSFLIERRLHDMLGNYKFGALEHARRVVEYTKTLSE